VIIKTILKEIEKFTKQPTDGTGLAEGARLPRGDPMFKFQLGDIPKFSVRHDSDRSTKKEKMTKHLTSKVVKIGILRLIGKGK